MFRHRSATPAGVTGNGEVRSLGDNVTRSSDRSWTREPTRRLPASRRSGASSPGQVNPGEVLIKAVIQRQAKDAVRLGPKGTWPGMGAPDSSVADDAPPADRHDLNPE